MTDKKLKAFWEKARMDRVAEIGSILTVFAEELGYKFPNIKLYNKKKEEAVKKIMEAIR